MMKCFCENIIVVKMQAELCLLGSLEHTLGSRCKEGATRDPFCSIWTSVIISLRSPVSAE